MMENRGVGITGPNFTDTCKVRGILLPKLRSLKWIFQPVATVLSSKDWLKAEAESWDGGAVW